jgi:DNA-binding SARP family transcriptional activator
LFAELDQKCRYPAIWVNGPPGSGKTTLTASYLQNRKLSALWYQIDEGDSDLATFFYYLGLAAQKATPRKKKSLPLLTPEYTFGIPTFSRRFFENLFGGLKKPAALVLDNYQDVLPDSLFHAVIREALSVIPEGINVFILSRTGPTPALARARANNHLDLLGWPELRLRNDEARELVRFLSRKEYSDEVIEAFQRKTDGWLAGLLLLLKRPRPEDLELEFLPLSTPQAIFDFFAQEIFERVATETQDFLLATSAFPRLTPAMAEALTGINRAKEILLDLNRGHNFTDRRSGEAPTYQYHPLFREFLLEKASQVYEPGRLAALKNKAARLLEGDGQVETAVSLFQKLGDIENLVRLILSQAHLLMSQGRHKTLEQWLALLPESVINETPWLVYWQGACLLHLNPPAARTLFEKALPLFERIEDIAGTFLALCGVFDSITFGFSSFELFDQWIPKMTAKVEASPSFPSPEIEARVIISMLFALNVRQPGHRDVDLWRKRALDSLPGGLEPEIKIRMAVSLTINHLLAGEQAEAYLLIQTYRYLTQTKIVSPFTRLIFMDAEAFCCWFMGKSVECQRVVSTARELASANGLQVFSFFIEGYGAADALSSGKLALAAEFLRNLEEPMNGLGPWGKSFFHFLAAWSSILSGDSAQALLHSELAVSNSSQAGMPHTLAYACLGQALTLQAAGKKERASESLAESLAIGRRTKSLVTQFGCHLARAEFALEEGDEAVAREALQEAMSIGREKGYVNIWFWRPRIMAELCCQALEAGIEVDYVRGLIQRRKLTPEESPLMVENWLWPVKIHTLGRFALELNGRPFSFDGRIRKKPLTLLKVLIALGGRNGIPEADVLDKLWPELEGDAAANTFSITLHRLRKILGTEKAVRVSEGKIFLDDRACWVDVWPLEIMLEQASTLWDNGKTPGDRDQAARLTEKAAFLKNGVFLPGEGDPWVMVFRERMEYRFLRGLENLGWYHEDSGHLGKAAHSYHRGLELDPCLEYFTQRLMHCYQQLGRRSEALRAYESCRQNLNAVLGVEPSEKTRLIYQSLLRD